MNATELCGWFHRLRAQLAASGPILEEIRPQKLESSLTAAEREIEMQQLKDQMQQDMLEEVSLHKSMSEQAVACIKADLERKVCIPLLQIVTKMYSECQVCYPSIARFLVRLAEV